MGLQPESLRNKGEDSNQQNLETKKEKLTTNTAEIQSIIRDYYKQLYDNKIDNLEEMEKFFERYNFSRRIRKYKQTNQK